MTGVPKLDGRRAKALETELRRRAEVVLSGDGRSIGTGPIVNAILAVASRIGEEVTSRLDKVPAKQADNFYNAAGIGRDPARPASVPVAFTVADGNPATSAPAGTQLMASTNGSVVFETATRIDVVPGRVAAVRGLDADNDAIFLPADAVIAADLPPVPGIVRRLRGGAAAGTAQVQIDPAAGLEPGALLSIGDGAAAREYRATVVEGDLVTLDPPLETALEPHVTVRDVIDFAPFDHATRNHQSHALYLGHASMLDLPSPATIHVDGEAIPSDAEWSWWGKLGENDPPAWQRLPAAMPFQKEAGTPVKRKIGGIESLWLRAQLPGKSAGSRQVRKVTLAVGGDLCSGNRQPDCAALSSQLNVGFEAMSNNVPVVVNGPPFHPFGREPRLYDAFYVGSDEAFAKAGAKVSLCLEFGGANFGPIAAVSNDAQLQVFGVGGDGLLYRADFTATPPRFDLVPLPADIHLQGQAPIAARISGSRVVLAIGSQDRVDIAELEFTSRLEPGSVRWAKCAVPDGVTGIPVAVALVVGAMGPDVFALFADGAMVSWKAGARPVTTHRVTALLPLQGTTAIVFVVDESIDEPAQRLSICAPDGSVRDDIELTGNDVVFTRKLSAWATDAQADLFLAAYSSPTGPLTFFKCSKNAASNIGEFTTAQTLPISFVRDGNGAWPMAGIATDKPTWFGFADGKFHEIAEPYPIGADDNGERAFVFADRWTVVQRNDLGLSYRRATSAKPVEQFSFAVDAPIAALGPRTAIAADNYIAAPASRRYRKQRGFRFGTTEDYRLLKSLGSANPPPPNASNALVFVGTDAVGTVDVDNDEIGLVLTASGDPFDTADTVVVALSKTEQPFDEGFAGIWELEPVNGKTDRWALPSEFAGAGSAGMPGYFKVLKSLKIDLLDAAEPVGNDEERIRDQLHTGPLCATINSDHQIDRLQIGDKYLMLPPGAVVQQHVAAAAYSVEMIAAPESWQQAGPDQPSNPALSWEYWNGAAWWALAGGNRDQGFQDFTANFQKNGGVFFQVPPDIAATDVGGKKIHWIRARLIGGDYGEAEVRQVGTSPSVFKRDISTIRAPLITKAKLGYCARTPVTPEHVLTEDSLGFVDQTSANVAGLAFPVFMPVAELMNPVDAAATAATAAASDRCDDPCADEEDAPSPCDAPGAYDSCDSACVAPPGYRRPKAAAAAGFVRGLMVGFDRPFAGEAVTLYADAEPTGPPVELIAEILYGGHYLPVRVTEDTSHGFTEPGILTLFLPEPPDQSGLLGTSAHWLRLRPTRDPDKWSPRLHGLYLNAVLARSIETRTMERLGASIAVENQEFRLAEGPIRPDSLELRVREALAEEEISDVNLDSITFPAGPPGNWVRWLAAADLGAAGAARRFQLDAEQGAIRFGDGNAGMIPPLGADILAVRYEKVVGANANGVAPGAKISPISSLAGVERVVALDHAGGGVDVEALDQARRRAPAKVRHGNRIVTRSDLEDYALTLSPWIAQVRAVPWQTGTRLVVVMKGPEPRPLPAQLRGFAEQIREVAAFGLSRAGGLDVVAPRLLPLAIRLTLQPTTPSAFAEAAAQAVDALTALFDPATGNHDKRGWPLGRLPDDADIAAALTPIQPFALPVNVVVERADRAVKAERVLPDIMPSDVLVRLDKANIAFDRAQEEAA